MDKLNFGRRSVPGCGIKHESGASVARDTRRNPPISSCVTVEVQKQNFGPSWRSRDPEVTSHTPTVRCIRFVKNEGTLMKLIEIEPVVSLHL